MTTRGLVRFGLIAIAFIPISVVLVFTAGLIAEGDHATLSALAVTLAVMVLIAGHLGVIALIAATLRALAHRWGLTDADISG